jgi:hypothetical protein
MKKTIAIILSVLLVMGVVSIAAVSAAADATVKIGENTFECAQGDTLTYTINMTTPKEIENGQFIVYYPGSCLTVKSVEFNKDVFGDDKPILNTEVENEINFNFSRTDGYDFTEKSEMIKIAFEVTGTGEGEINISDKEEEVIVCDIDDVDITDQVEFEELGNVTGEETEPATEEETQPASGEETQPASGEETQPASGEETQPASGEVTEPATGEPQPATDETQPVAAKTYKYIPSIEDIASGKNFKITVEDANSETHVFDLIPTTETVDGQPVYAADIPESIDASKINYQVFDGETFISQVTKEASEVADGGAVKYDGTITVPDTTQPASDETQPATGETQSDTIAPTAPVVTAPAATNPPSATVKKAANTMKVTVKAKAIKAKKLKKKKQTVKAITVKNAKGTVTFAKVKKGTTSKIFKKVKVNKKTGKITFKKGKYAKKTYKIKVKIKAAGKKVGNTQYQAKTITKVVKIKVK